MSDKTTQILDAARIRVSALADGGSPADPAGLLVGWTPPADLPADWLTQVYVNGELAAVTGEPGQRELAVPADLAGGAAASAVQVVVVRPDRAWTDHGRLLDRPAHGSRALIRWARTNDAELGATIHVFGDHATGQIDWDRPLNDAPIDWFPDGHGKWGLGLAGFGLAGFGEDAAGAPGQGGGAFGLGPFGFDAEWACWLSPPLPPGTHQLAVVAYDRLGNPADSPVLLKLDVPAAPDRIACLAAQAAPEGQLVLGWQSDS